MKRYPGLMVQVVKDGKVVLRKPTEVELVKSKERFELIEAARARLAEAETVYAELQATCDHRVVFDTPGSPHDVRRCGACNKLLDSPRVELKRAR